MKILMVGLGGIGQRYPRNLRALLGDDVEILAYRVRKFSPVITPTLQIDDDARADRRGPWRGR